MKTSAAGSRRCTTTVFASANATAIGFCTGASDPKDLSRQRLPLPICVREYTVTADRPDGFAALALVAGPSGETARSTVSDASKRLGAWVTEPSALNVVTADCTI